MVVTGKRILGRATNRTRPIDPATTQIDNNCYDGFHDGWWDLSGPVAGLHEMNLVRCNYFDRVFEACLGTEMKASGRFIDIGCGGGIVTEALARRGYRITGFDISLTSLEAARRHAEAAGVEVEYRVGSALDLSLDPESVDGVVISDVLEHLHDLPLAVSEIARLLKPGGVMVFDTINRTLRSYFLAIVLAQRMLKMVHANTHDWRLFITPEELAAVLESCGLSPVEFRGLTPVKCLPAAIAHVMRSGRIGGFAISDDLSVLYMGYAVRAPNDAGRGRMKKTVSAPGAGGAGR